MVRYSLNLALLILIISGCTFQEGDELGIEGEIKIFEVNSDIDSPELFPIERIFSDEILVPLDLVVTDSFITLIDVAADQAVHVIDKDNLSYISSFGNKGEGPNEFLSPWSIETVVSKENGIWIFDFQLLRYSSYEIKQQEDSLLFIPENLIHLEPHIGSPFHVSWLNEKMIISTGIYPQGRIAIYDSSGIGLKSVGPLPNLSPRTFILPFFKRSPNIPANVLQHAYQSKVKPKPDGSLFVVATRHSDRLEIYNEKGERLYKILGKNPEPEFDMVVVDGQPVLAQNNNFYFGYVDVSVNNNFIYCLYSGRIQQEENPTFGNQIHVFDWNGNFIKMYSLQEDLISIEIDEDGKLYGIQHYPSVSINIYNSDI